MSKMKVEVIKKNKGQVISSSSELISDKAFFNKFVEGILKEYEENKSIEISVNITIEKNNYLISSDSEESFKRVVETVLREVYLGTEDDDLGLDDDEDEEGDDDSTKEKAGEEGEGEDEKNLEGTEETGKDSGKDKPEGAPF